MQALGVLLSAVVSFAPTSVPEPEVGDAHARDVAGTQPGGANAPSDATGSEAGPVTEADLRRQAGEALKAKDYLRVLEVTAQAYALTGAVEHLFAQAQIHRLLGDCTAALALYGRVLAVVGEEDELSVEAREGIRVCEPEARKQALLTQAAEALEAKDYPRVLEVAAQAYALTGAVEHLFAQAQIKRLLGECPAALALYGRVLAVANGEDDDLTAKAREGIRACESQAREQVSDRSSGGGSSDSKQNPVDGHDPPPLSSDHAIAQWVHDPVGGALFGVGAAGLAGGAALSVASWARRRAADAASDEQSYAELRRRSRSLLVGSAAAFAAGGALVLGAVLRYSVVARRLRVRVQVHPMTHGLSLSGRF